MLFIANGVFRNAGNIEVRGKEKELVELSDLLSGGHLPKQGIGPLRGSVPWVRFAGLRGKGDCDSENGNQLTHWCLHRQDRSR